MGQRGVAALVGVSQPPLIALEREGRGRVRTLDQVRQVIVAGLRELHFVAHPLGGVLAGIVGFAVVGRADELRCWGDIVRLMPRVEGPRGLFQAGGHRLQGFVRPGLALPRLLASAGETRHPVCSTERNASGPSSLEAPS
jgi:hypothetical protein